MVAADIVQLARDQVELYMVAKFVSGDLARRVGVKCSGGEVWKIYEERTENVEVCSSTSIHACNQGGQGEGREHSSKPPFQNTPSLLL